MSTQNILILAPLFFVAVVCTMPRVLQAELLLYEGFDYAGTLSDGDSISGANEGIGWNGSWSGGQTWTDSGLSYVNNGILRVSGGAVMDADDGNRAANRPIMPVLGQDGQTVWFSYLVDYHDARYNRVLFGKDDGSGFGTDAGLTNNDGDLSALVHDQGVATDPNGLLQVSQSNGNSWQSTGTHFIVGRAVFSAANDQLDIWWDIDLTQTEANLGPPDSSITADIEIGAANLFALISGNAAISTVDEIRLGETFADVVVLGVSETVVFSIGSAGAYDTQPGAGVLEYSQLDTLVLDFAGNTELENGQEYKLLPGWGLRKRNGATVTVTNLPDGFYVDTSKLFTFGTIRVLDGQPVTKIQRLTWLDSSEFEMEFSSASPLTDLALFSSTDLLTDWEYRPHSDDGINPPRIDNMAYSVVSGSTASITVPAEGERRFYSIREPEPPRPNIVIIFADDMGYADLGCFGNTDADTPRLDTLAQQGTRFTSFYAENVCGPARSTLLTGRQPYLSGGWQMSSSEITIAEALREAGYATACIGKWDVSNRFYKQGKVPNDQGFDYFWGSLGANDLGEIELWDNRISLGISTDMAGLTRTLTDKAILWLDGHLMQNEPEPFLLYVAHTMTHTVIDASPDFKNGTGNGLYADVMQEFDHECGRLIDYIDNAGLGEDTLVIFTSDNGPWSNTQSTRINVQNNAGVVWSAGPQIAWGSSGPFRGAKGSVYEGGHREPTIMRWTGTIPAGRTSDAIACVADFMPTFGTLAGYGMPEDRAMNGDDLTPLLFGHRETGRDTYLYMYTANHRHGVRKGKWKLLYEGVTNVAGYAQAPSSSFELYDLEADPGETTNLADANPDVVAELNAIVWPED